MLRWEKDINGYNGHWMGGYIGFDDDCPLYRVGENDEGWYYDNLAELVIIEGYDTAEEAMAAAEFEVAAKEIEIDWDDFEPLTWEDLEYIHLDETAHERMEIMKGLC